MVKRRKTVPFVRTFLVLLLVGAFVPELNADSCHYEIFGKTLLMPTLGKLDTGWTPKELERLRSWLLKHPGRERPELFLRDHKELVDSFQDLEKVLEFRRNELASLRETEAKQSQEREGVLEQLSWLIRRVKSRSPVKSSEEIEIELLLQSIEILKQGPGIRIRDLAKYSLLASEILYTKDTLTHASVAARLETIDKEVQVTLSQGRLILPVLKESTETVPQKVYKLHPLIREKLFRQQQKKNR